MNSIGSAFTDFGVGALGGLVFLLASQIFGGLGLIAAPLLAGSVIKGERGKTIAVVSGFMLLAMVAMGINRSSGSSADAGVM